MKRTDLTKLMRDVKHCEQGIKNGGILMGLKPRSNDDAAYFEQEWKSSKLNRLLLHRLKTDRKAMLVG